MQNLKKLSSLVKFKANEEELTKTQGGGWQKPKPHLNIYAGCYTYTSYNQYGEYYDSDNSFDTNPDYGT